LIVETVLLGDVNNVFEMLLYEIARVLFLNRSEAVGVIQTLYQSFRCAGGKSETTKFVLSSRHAKFYYKLLEFSHRYFFKQQHDCPLKTLVANIC